MIKPQWNNPKFLEEAFSSSSHLVGALLSLAALVIMVVYSSFTGDAWKIVSYSIYGVSLVFLYSASALYHGSGSKSRLFFNKLDHAAIYILIAGTYTPYTLVPLRGGWGWSIFGVIWGLAIAGVIFKLFYYKHKWRAFSTIVYLLMGWIVVIAINPLFKNLSKESLLWLAAGGVFYSSGVIFYFYKKIPFGHGIWHLFVLGGSLCHFISIFFYL